MKLTDRQIEVYASRPGVRRIAVENFLGSLGGVTASDARENLHLDEGLYRWNAATVRAIADGIDEAERGHRGGGP